MTPDDLVLVERSWTELRAHRPLLLERLAEALPADAHGGSADAHARRLLDATAALVDLLATPSHLAAAARAIAVSWGTAPTPRVDVDGVAWMRAAREVCPTWSSSDDVAWRRAWVLLADVLAEESLAPFAGPLDADLPALRPYVAPAVEAT